MSIWTKFLWGPIVIDGANQTFGYNDGAPQTVDIDPASYDTILEVVANLDGKLGGGYTAEVSEIGIVSIASAGALTEDWPNTDDLLEAILGFDGTEAAVGNVITANEQHPDGYYPGLLSWGYEVSKGCPRNSGAFWKAKRHLSRTVAGNRAARITGPSTAQEIMNLRFGLIKVEEEYNEDALGLRAFWDDCATDDFRYYPDRALGTATTPGTQDTDYFLCTFSGDLKERQNSRRPDLCTFSFEMNREP